MGYITQLQAINEMLIAAGEQPVTSLSTPTADIGVAQAILDFCSRDFQINGFSANTFQKDYAAGSTISLGTNILSVSVYEQPYSDRVIGVTIIDQSGPKLYNVTDDTINFSDLPSGEIKLMEIRMLDWADIPTAQQIEIVGNAKQKYQMIVQGDKDMNQQLLYELGEARKIARQNDSIIKQRSILDSYFNPIARLLDRNSSHAFSNYPLRARRPYTG